MISPCRGKKRIFVFDRDSAFVEALSLFFTGTHEVYGFKSVEEIGNKDDVNPDIILLDVFPLISTEELSTMIGKVRKFYYKIPILVISTSKSALRKAKKSDYKSF